VLVVFWPQLQANGRQAPFDPLTHPSRVGNARRYGSGRSLVTPLGGPLGEVAPSLPRHAVHAQARVRRKANEIAPEIVCGGDSNHLLGCSLSAHQSSDAVLEEVR
jgi:hypothetical protein